MAITSIWVDSVAVNGETYISKTDTLTTENAQLVDVTVTGNQAIAGITPFNAAQMSGLFLSSSPSGMTLQFLTASAPVNIVLQALAPLSWRADTSAPSPLSGVVVTGVSGINVAYNPSVLTARIVGF